MALWHYCISFLITFILSLLCLLFHGLRWSPFFFISLFLHHFKHNIHALIAQTKTKYILKFFGSRAFWFGELSPHIVSPIQQTPIAPKPKPIWEMIVYERESFNFREREKKWLKWAKSAVVLKTPKSFTAIPKPKNPNLRSHQRYRRSHN